MSARAPAWVSVLLLALLATSCGEAGRGSPPYYQDNDLQLLTLYAAKTMCSCLFVMGQSESFCRAYTKQSPALNTYQIDTKNKAVTSSAVLLWSARAHWVSQQEGCVLE